MSFPMPKVGGKRVEPSFVRLLRFGRQNLLFNHHGFYLIYQFEVFIHC